MFVAGIEIVFGFIAAMIMLTVVACCFTAGYYMLKAALNWVSGRGFSA